MEGTESIETNKHLLRQEMRRRLAAMSPEERRGGSERIRNRIRDQLAGRTSGEVLGFVPHQHEPDVFPVLAGQGEAGWRLWLPRWNADSGDYEPAPFDPGIGLVKGPFGVLEPPTGSPGLPFERLDLVLVPGLAFDRCGRRLGRGKGFFDRLLTRTRHAEVWGVAFDLQVVEAVPYAPHDVNINVLVTPEIWLPLANSGSV